jgi:hypothetical protein
MKNKNKGEKNMRRNRRAISNCLNLYKDQNRLLNYFGRICTVAYADKYNAKICIHKTDGTITEPQNVGALDLFDNLKIVTNEERA